MRRSAVDRQHTARTRLDGLHQTLRALSYKGTLARGYVVVRSMEGAVLDHAGTKAAGRVRLEFAHEKTLDAVTDGIAAKPRKGTKPPPEQGTLL